MVWPDAAEVAILAQRKVGVIHNPTSNLKLASGVSPVPQMLAAGVKVGLGTDGAASNNNLDMWQEMNLAALIHKAVALDYDPAGRHGAAHGDRRGRRPLASMPRSAPSPWVVGPI